MLERNRQPVGRLANIEFGFAQILDGLIRVLSFGFFHGRHRFTPLVVAGRQMRRYIHKKNKED